VISGQKKLVGVCGFSGFKIETLGTRQTDSDGIMGKYMLPLKRGSTSGNISAGTGKISSERGLTG
jgi:hypothetical protein